MSRFGLKYKDVAKILQTTTPKLMTILKNEGVILNTNGRNMPIPMYVKKGWFIVSNISFRIQHATGEQSKVPTQTIVITNKGLYEIERIFYNNTFTTVKTNNLFKDIEIYIRDFFNGKPLELFQDTIRVENENYVEIYYSSTRETELILKYQKDNNIIWIPK